MDDIMNENMIVKVLGELKLKKYAYRPTTKLGCPLIGSIPGFITTLVSPIKK